MRADAITKARFAALATHHGISESALLSRMVSAVLDRNDSNDGSDRPADRSAARDRISLRLRAGDVALLRTRAASRGMRPASYATALIHAHLRQIAPFPPVELNHLKALAGDLSAVVRLLRSYDIQGQSEDLLPSIQQAVTLATNLHEEVAAIVRSNLISWESGDV